jgi:hypothetical protein
MPSAGGRFRVLSSLFVACLMVALFGSAAGAESLTPCPQNAPRDYERLWTDGCFAFFTQTKPKDGCVFGDKTSTYKMVIVGDSHTSDFFAAFNRIAKAHGWKLYTFVKADCPFVDIAIYNAAATSERYPECAKWNENVLARLQQIKPNLTITIPFRWILPVNRKYATPTATGASIGRMLKKLTGEKVVIVDSPYSNFNVPSCVRSKGPNGCKIPKSSVLSGGVKTREQEAARVAGGHYINLTGKMCGGFPCRVVTGNVLEFRDNHHLTNTYAKAFAGTINDALKKALGL